MWFSKKLGLGNCRFTAADDGTLLDSGLNTSVEPEA
jgi:hypothetical protein